MPPVSIRGTQAGGPVPGSAPNSGRTHSQSLLSQRSQTWGDPEHAGLTHCCTPLSCTREYCAVFVLFSHMTKELPKATISQRGLSVGSMCP